MKKRAPGLRAAAVVGTAAALLFAFFLLFQSGGERGRPSPVDPAPFDPAFGDPLEERVPPAEALVAAPAAGGPATDSPGFSPQLPGSLEGTEPVGGFLVGADGHLVPTADALAFFDYFLSASGEEPEAMLRARILAAMRARVEKPASDEAEALLDDYLGFRDELRRLAEDGEPPHELERRLQWIRELRRAHFGEATAEALFGDEERTTLVDLERRRVAADPSLNESERAERLAALDAELPEHVRAARARARAPARGHQEAEAMRASGASDEEVFELRAAQFGREAAERLAELDGAQAVWNARLRAFEAELAEIEAKESDASDAAREAAVDALMREHFDEQEHLRVRAIEGL